MKVKLPWILSLILILSMVAVPASAGPAAPQKAQPAALSVTGVPTITADAPAYQPDDSAGPARYTVMLAAPAVASYTGGIEGLAPSAPRATGRVRLDAKSPAAKAYASYLESEQAAFVSSVDQLLGRSPEVVYQMQHALNAVVMVLQPSEAYLVSKLPGVKQVERDEAQSLDTDYGPAWIGAPGIWDGTATGGLPGTQGEEVIVGILDTGINMDHPSFATVGGDGYVHTNPFGSGNYLGWCNPANPNYDPSYVCNDKLIGAWDYSDASWGETGGPEDTDGHGSHTASTVAGNYLAPGTVTLGSYNYSPAISGVAPHANIIAYDVCGPSCYDTDLAAAINQSIIDGVMVLNESISISGDTWTGTKQAAYLGAFDAGVVASRSAGNAGPGAGTVGPEPLWTLASAASTHNRAASNALIDLMGGDTAPPADMPGLGLSNGVGPAPMVFAGDYGDALCLNPFAPGTFTGQIVVCNRGTNARVAKGWNVLAGGAVGMVLANTSAAQSLNGDLHHLPAVHITSALGNTLKTWLASGSGHMGTIAGATIDTSPSNGDVTAGFSSRGPADVAEVVKPNVTNPGVDILAAYLTGAIDPETTSVEYGLLSGTSMSSPHTAGSLALMVALHPTWTPAQIMSTLQTTASNAQTVKEDGVTPATPFDVGSGRVDLSQAGMAGLILDETGANFAASSPALGGDAKTLNLPSFQNNDCYKTCSWTRTVKNATDMTLNWSASYVGEGVGAAAPGAFTILLGDEATFTFSLDTVGLSPNQWHFGRLIWTEAQGLAPDVTMPVAVYVVASTDVQVVNKTVDKAQAYGNEVLTYQISLVNNSAFPQAFTLVDPIPANSTYVAGSATGGLTYNAGLNQMEWSGVLPPSGFFVAPGIGGPFGYGYVGLAGLGVPPAPCPSNCDDGGFTISGLSYSYLGTAYSDAIWSVNGTLQAGTAGGAAAGAANTFLPNAAAPNNLLAAWWRDLNLGAGGAWYVASLTDGIYNYTVFEWENVPLYGDLGSRATFQIWWVDGTDQIWYTYPPGAFTGDVTNGVTVGAENSTGTVGDTYYFNGSGTLPSSANDLLVVFSPPAPVYFGFQVKSTGPGGANVLNEVTVSDGVTTNQAYAYTVIVDPEVNPDYVTCYGWHMFIDVLANDLGVQPLQIVSVTQPLHGRSANYVTRALYIPTRGYKGPDQFDYTAMDAIGNTASATVYIWCQ